MPSADGAVGVLEGYLGDDAWLWRTRKEAMMSTRMRTWGVPD